MRGKYRLYMRCVMGVHDRLLSNVGIIIIIIIITIIIIIIEDNGRI